MDEIQRLISEIEMLRAEVRAAVAQGQQQQGLQSTNINNAAVGAVGLHALTAQGFVSGLTGSKAKTSKDWNNPDGSFGKFYPSYRGIRYAEIGEWESEGVYATHMGVQSVNPASTKKYKYGLPSWYRKLDVEDQVLANAVSGYRKTDPHFTFDRLTNKINKIEHAEQKMMLRHEINAYDRKYGKSFYGKAWKRMQSKYGRPAAIIGLASGAINAIESWETESDRPKYLTNAEERAGLTLEDKFGTVPSLSSQIAASVGKVAGSTAQFMAMSYARDKFMTDNAFRIAKLESRRMVRNLTGDLAPRSLKMTGVHGLRALGNVGMGMARALGPLAIVSAAISVGEEFYEQSELKDRRKLSDKKLTSQMNELQSMDRLTSQAKIDSELLRRGHTSATDSPVSWMGSQFLRMFTKTFSLGFYGGTEGPSQKEDRLRTEMSKDLKEAETHGEEAKKEALLGNARRADLAAKKARKLAGDLAPAIWQNPMSWFTMQEQAQMGKASFARYLNTRVNNRTGD